MTTCVSSRNHLDTSSTDPTRMEGTDSAQAPKLTLSVSDRRKVWLRSTFIQGAMNYERMQALGWCYSMVPVMHRLWRQDADRSAFLKRHLEFFNTHPYLVSPILGVEMALEEQRANGAEVDDEAIQGVKIGMMGPLAGVGDPIFWGTLRPVLGAFAAALALSANMLGPAIFFLAWNAIRLAFTWYTQELGYRQGSNITKDLSGGMMQKVTTGASILGMFIMGVLIPRWTSIDLSKLVFSSTSMGTVADKFPALDTLTSLVNGGGTITAEALQNGLSALSSISSSGYSIVTNGNVAQLVNTVTLQSVLNQLLPGLLPLGLTIVCIVLLKRKVSPIAIIFGLFAVGILGALVGIF